ncbi:hypothetical protein MT325_M734L [Paramecium bursaria chlorella virus MT325]|uniref:Uncharacterized protein M734L n=1 Tax=Paramecium bursaria Chlorella virus MT325 TaxID=346932 RepID=A7IVB4_PBCVM|nr:hypothetical protein MT325_M734L [Paramecium bursaria chlorella virus MT325]
MRGNVQVLELPCNLRESIGNRHSIPLLFFLCSGIISICNFLYKTSDRLVAIITHLHGKFFCVINDRENVRVFSRTYFLKS